MGKLIDNKFGKIIVLIQLFWSIGLPALIWDTKLLPAKYLALITAALLIISLICVALQFRGKFLRALGTLISILMIIVLLFGSFYVVKAERLMSDVGGATYKTDNMIVVVREDDSAETILDAAEYRFGVQTTLDQENNSLMIKDIENAVGKPVKTEEYETITEEAQALLEGRIKAAVYNEAFTEIIEESIEDYSDKVKIIHQYGIETEIKVEEADLEKPFNIYISGIDVSGEITTNSRSDVNIIMTVNPNTHGILLTTTPRDYYVQIPNISGEQKDKLTHAGIYGVDVSMDTLESIYGIDISYYAKVNFTSLIEIVDAIGGIDVYSEYAFSAGGYDFIQGANHMNGEQALAFSRERYSFESGDNQRGKNQEAVLKAIIEKAMSPALLKNANQIIASVADSVETNMTQEEMAKFINMQLESGAGWYIETEAATGNGDSQACFSSGDQLLYVMQPDWTSVERIQQKMNELMQAEPMK